MPAGTEVLIAELSGVGKEYPLSREKLSPVLSFYTVENWREGCERCIELLEFGGIGHTLVIHSMDEDIIMKFALEKPAFRILVNTQAALGAVGYTNELLPSMTLGPGTFGGSIISDNVSAKHMFNVKRLAFETRPINPPEAEPSPEKTPSEKRDTGSKVREYPAIKPAISHNRPTAIPKPAGTKSWLNEIDERIRLKAGNVPVQSKKAPPSHTEPKPGTLGTGISEEEADRIIREFSKR